MSFNLTPYICIKTKLTFNDLQKKNKHVYIEFLLKVTDLFIYTIHQSTVKNFLAFTTTWVLRVESILSRLLLLTEHFYSYQLRSFLLRNRTWMLSAPLMRHVKTKQRWKTVLCYIYGCSLFFMDLAWVFKAKLRHKAQIKFWKWKMYFSFPPYNLSNDRMATGCFL